jgi:hypothetical protein
VRCFTAALLLLYWRFTGALLALYWRFTAALLLFPVAFQPLYCGALLLKAAVNM